MWSSRAHLPAYGAVGEVELLGRAREAFEPRRRLERAERRERWEAARHL
jgi:hypothetical protein